MSNSLRDQLLNLGFKAQEKKSVTSGSKNKPGGKKSAAKHTSPTKTFNPASNPAARNQSVAKKTGHGAEMDLARAYSMRAQQEKDERIEAERIKQEEARKRREARQALETFLQGKSLNAEHADVARHFEYGGKIKRIYVTEAQLKALNAGELGVAQLRGRYMLVTATDLCEVERIFAEAVALKVDPNQPAGDDVYADPKYQIPDDLVW